MRQEAVKRLAKGKVNLRARLTNGIRLTWKGLLEDIIDDEDETHIIRTELARHEISARAVAKYGR